MFFKGKYYDLELIFKEWCAYEDKNGKFNMWIYFYKPNEQLRQERILKLKSVSDANVDDE